MPNSAKAKAASGSAAILPDNRGLFYGGAWHESVKGGTIGITNPATGKSLGVVANASEEDVDRAAKAAQAGFHAWSIMSPTDRSDRIYQFADALRANAEELATLDAINCGGPVSEMLLDVETGARGIEYFAGLVSEIKGETIPLGQGYLNYTVREPLGVVARIIAYNHPILFATMRCAAPLVAGNSILLKPSEQAPLSTLRLAELVSDIFPPGVFNVLTGDRTCGAALSTHPIVSKVMMIGSVPTGKAILRAAADTMKQVGLELGGKNALIGYPDCDASLLANGAVSGMNFTWASQSCGSTSRVFLHESHYDAVLEDIVRGCKKYRPGLPTNPQTTMGPLISQAQLDKVIKYIEWGKADGARLALGGKRPEGRELQGGFFVEPTVFADVTMQMRIAREEIFGPVLSVIKWSDEDELFQMVNAVDYGLTGSVFTRDLVTAHRAAARIQAGYIWINHVGPHYLGAPFGGYKQSGLGREECLDELLASTQIKNVCVRL